MEKIRIAVAGLGKAFRDIHLPAYRKIKRLQIVGGSDPLVHGTNFGIPVFASVDEMLEKTHPDILSVVTPPSTHFELVRLGLASGCHVFCEKPFTTTLEEADAVIALSRQCKRWVVVNNQYRFMNIHREAKQWIGRPEFGELLFLNAQQTFYTTEATEAGWRGEDTQRTCREFGTHIFDLCRYYFDEDPVAVVARMPRAHQPNGPDYLNLILLEFPGDRVAHIVLDRLCRGPHNYLTIRLDGSEGCLETRLGGGIEIATGIRGGTRRPFVNFDFAMGGRARYYQGERYRQIATDPLDIFAHATAQLVKAYIDALDQNETPPNSAEENRRTLAIMLAACQSAQVNKRIMID